MARRGLQKIALELPLACLGPRGFVGQRVQELCSGFKVEAAGQDIIVAGRFSYGPVFHEFLGSAIS